MWNLIKQFSTIFIAILVLTGCGVQKQVNPKNAAQLQKAKTQSVMPETVSPETKDVSKDKTNKPYVAGMLKVHFLDVGQADSILVELPNSEEMLIDAGNNDDRDTILNYIKNQGIKKLDYVIGTHPHEDHIGSMDH